MSASYEQSGIKNVHKPKPSDMCDAIRQAVKTMENYLADSEIKDMIVCDKCTLTTEYRPQLTADLERLYDSLDNHDKGVLQDRLDDMWIMYCTARYTDKEAIAREGMQCTVDSNEGYKMALYFLVQKTPTEPKAVVKFQNMDLVYRYHKEILPQTALPMTATMYKRVAELNDHYFMFRRISFKEYRKSYASLTLKEYKLVFDFEKE